ncbi:MAG: nicotinate (nicotinamide) nucleotide adenylyltransferase [Chthonomonas sp.]|nr:nicotinate (nicotinamide) nucleotide adenylyltransferase [Chthonomonas sp.]
MKIGIFGGTFDPPHAAHLEMAHAARATLGLDEIIFVPAYQNPLKVKARNGASPRHRFRMVQALIQGEEGLSVSDIEITRSGLSFTVETLEEMQKMIPGEYWLIMGSDSLDSIYNWKQPDRIASLCRIAVILRPPHTQDDALRHVPDYVVPVIDWIDMTPSKTSSTTLRTTIQLEERSREQVPTAVLNYIAEHKLYPLH